MGSWRIVGVWFNAKMGMWRFGFTGDAYIPLQHCYDMKELVIS